MGPGEGPSSRPAASPAHRHHKGAPTPHARLPFHGQCLEVPTLSLPALTDRLENVGGVDDQAPHWWEPWTMGSSGL